MFDARPCRYAISARGEQFRFLGPVDEIPFHKRFQMLLGFRDFTVGPS
jgi:hypothetical protein